MTPVLWRLLRTYRWRLAAAMGLQALAGLCSLLPWMLLAWLAEPLARGQAQPALLALVLLAVLAWLGCQALAAHLAHRVDADLCNDLRLRLLAHLQRLPLDWFGRQGPDGVARLVEQDVRALHQLIAHAPNDLSNLLVVPLVALLWLAWLHPWLLLFCLLPLVLAAAGFLLLRSARYRDLVLRRNAALERLSADYGEFAHNLLLARQYPGAGIQQGAESSAAAFGEAFGAWVKRVGHLAALVYVQLSTPWLLAWVLLGALALDALGVPLALGQACAFLLLLRALAAPVQALGHGGDALLGARAAAERLQQVFDQAPLVEGRSTREPVDGAVALHGLGHAYEGVEVLADIDLAGGWQPGGPGRSLGLRQEHPAAPAGALHGRAARRTGGWRPGTEGHARCRAPSAYRAGRPAGGGAGDIPGRQHCPVPPRCRSPGDSPGGP